MNAKERAIEELEQLNDRIGKLDSFMKSDKIQKLDNEAFDMLSQQLISMKDYAFCLTKRIETWKEIE